MMNKLWALFIIIGTIFAFFSGSVDVINNEIIEYPKEIFEIFLSMLPLMVIWSGIMNIAKDAGILKKISQFMQPLFRIIFPDIPKGHESLDYIATNLTINMLGEQSEKIGEIVRTIQNSAMSKHTVLIFQKFH